MTGTADPAAIRAALGERLPAYMVPVAVVVLAALPLTVNGKLDKRALPAPEYQDADRYRAPATLTEEVLAGIYAQVLGLDRVGVDDSFFELGGDSILSMQVVARARAAGVLCRPRDIFVEQTVARLARVAGVVGGEPVWWMRVWGRWWPRRSCAGCTTWRGRSSCSTRPWWCRPRWGWPRPMWWWWCRGCWIVTPCCVAGCEDDGAGGWSLLVPEVGAVDARACVHAVEVLTEAAVVGARSQLDPAAGVMLRAVWVGSTGQLVLIVHHLAVDGVSWRILLEDLSIAWAQHRSGQPVALPAGGTSFARWSALLAEHAHDAGVVAQAGCGSRWGRLRRCCRRCGLGWIRWLAPGTCRWTGCRDDAHAVG